MAHDEKELQSLHRHAFKTVCFCLHVYSVSVSVRPHVDVFVLNRLFIYLCFSMKSSKLTLAFDDGHPGHKLQSNLLCV